MGLHILAEAVLRVEHKLDALLRHLQVPMPPPMHFAGAMCPTCGVLIDYQVDLTHNVVLRKCNCKTGKVPSLIPLVPATSPIPGASNAGRSAGEPEVPAEDGAGRQVRPPRAR